MCLCARATRGHSAEHGVCGLAPELPADRVRPTGHGSVGKLKSLLAAIVECSAYIEGVTPDGLKDLHGKGLEALSQRSRSHSESHCDFFPIKPEKEFAMGKLSIIYRKISELKPYPRNARTHSRKQVKQIAAAIMGSGSPIRS